jgi:hypothetical protein
MISSGMLPKAEMRATAVDGGGKVAKFYIGIGTVLHNQENIGGRPLVLQFPLGAYKKNKRNGFDYILYFWTGFTGYTGFLFRLRRVT